MTEQKQIEEMAKVLDECCNRYDENGNFLGNKCSSCEYWCDTNHLCCSYGNKEATAFYNAGYRKQEWISVEERLPDECGMPVLMVAVNQYSQTRVVKGFTDYQCPITFHTNEREYDGVWRAWEVTHWMPLPMPPKGDDGK